jgi:NAD(P)-dependent dehydrogenase (short-subunit alcohol dehydrogenase family)
MAGGGAARERRWGENRSLDPRRTIMTKTVPQVRYAGVTYSSLAGAGVIVTGGALGIGADIVRAFAGQRAKVGFVDRDVAAGRALARSLPGTCFEACDVTDVPALQAAIGRLAQQVSGVDVLVNNVANDERHKLDEVTPEYFDGRIAVNLRPHFFATQAVLPSMRARGGGSIVNIGSGSWKNKTIDLAVYATAKSAMLGFTRVLARELGASNIRVNCVVPGWVMTERQVSLWVDEAGERAMDENQCLPGRIVGADIAHMVLFLAADTSRMVTAAEIVVDAGWA